MYVVVYNSGFNIHFPNTNVVDYLQMCFLSSNTENFTYSFPTCMPFIFFLPYYISQALQYDVEKECGHPYHAPIPSEFFHHECLL